MGKGPSGPFLFLQLVSACICCRHACRFLACSLVVSYEGRRRQAMKFKTTILQSGNNTGIEVPA